MDQCGARRARTAPPTGPRSSCSGASPSPPARPWAHARLDLADHRQPRPAGMPPAPPSPSRAARASRPPSPACSQRPAAPQLRQRAEMPAVNGHGNARSIVRIQTLLANRGKAFGETLMSPAGCMAVMEEQTNGMDLVLGVPVRFGLGYGLLGGDGPSDSERERLFLGRLRGLHSRLRPRRPSGVLLCHEPHGCRRTRRRTRHRAVAGGLRIPRLNARQSPDERDRQPGNRRLAGSRMRLRPSPMAGSTATTRQSGPPPTRIAG